MLLVVTCYCLVSTALREALMRITDGIAEESLKTF